MTQINLSDTKPNPLRNPPYLWQSAIRTKLNLSESEFSELENFQNERMNQINLTTHSANSANSDSDNHLVRIKIDKIKELTEEFDNPCLPILKCLSILIQTKELRFFVGLQSTSENFLRIYDT